MSFDWYQWTIAVAQATAIVCLGVFYFLPAIIAHRRAHRNFVAIIVLNIVAGWTFVGWVVALVWSLVRE
jgi:hypothetical protein